MTRAMPPPQSCRFWRLHAYMRTEGRTGRANHGSSGNIVAIRCAVRESVRLGLARNDRRPTRRLPAVDLQSSCYRHVHRALPDGLSMDKAPPWSYGKAPQIALPDVPAWRALRLDASPVKPHQAASQLSIFSGWSANGQGGNTLHYGSSTQRGKNCGKGRQNIAHGRLGIAFGRKPDIVI
ncbi:hypothetical protein FH972_026672 [Carpinus fangiana]|uniref:Uncharacterized protein n=1 Tax=Carpinus fangiana TaxID=176857 RepID=A0A5N6L5L5_9ROSI|nr:hypothetical protein FH972_026672 [Carpinus fangiana]